MRIILVTGGARSGKSSYAQQLAARLGGASVTVVATATASDDEMSDRIARHQSDRPAEWTVVELPTRAARCLATVSTHVVLVDCLTMLAANAAREANPDGPDRLSAAVLLEVDELLDAARTVDGSLIIVTNEVGSSIHPSTALGRWFQDALGRANQTVARAADDVVLLVCGCPVIVKGCLP